jgi:hypothetical protein
VSGPPDPFAGLMAGWEALSGRRFAGDDFAGELSRFSAAYGEFARGLGEAAERARGGAEGSLEERLAREMKTLRDRFALAPFFTPFAGAAAPAAPVPPAASFFPGGLADLLAPLSAAGGAGPVHELERLSRALAEAIAAAGPPARAFADALAKVTLAGFDRYSRELSERLAHGAPTPALEELFERLLECGESAYRECLEHELAPAQAQALNAGLAVAKAARALYECQARLFGLPTQADVDALEERLLRLERRP